MKLYLRILLVTVIAAAAAALFQAGFSGLMLRRFSSLLKNTLSDAVDSAMKRGARMSAEAEASLASEKMDSIFKDLENLCKNTFSASGGNEFFEREARECADLLLVFQNGKPVFNEVNPNRSTDTVQPDAKGLERMLKRLSSKKGCTLLECSSDTGSFWLAFVRDGHNFAAARINGRAFLHSLVKAKDEGFVFALAAGNAVLAEYAVPDRRPEISMRAIRRFIFSDLNGRTVLADGTLLLRAIRFSDAPNWYPRLVPVNTRIGGRTIYFLVMLPEPEGVTALYHDLNTVLRHMIMWFFLLAAVGTFLIFLPAVWTFCRSLHKNLGKILDYTEKVADGKDPGEALAVSGTVEYREFSGSLNLLRDRFSAAVERLKKCREQEMKLEMESDSTRLLRGGMMAAVVSGMRRSLHLIRGYSSLQNGKIESDLPEGIAARQMSGELRTLASSLRGLEELSLLDGLQDSLFQAKIDIPGLMRRALGNAGSEASLRGQILETKCSHDPGKVYCTSPAVLLHLFTSALSLLSETAAGNSRISLISAEEGGNLIFLCRSFRNARETDLPGLYEEYSRNGYVSSALAAPVLLRLKIMEKELQAIDGTMKLFTPPDGGTAVSFIFPLRDLKPVPGDDGCLPRRIRSAVKISRKQGVPVTVCAADDSPAERKLIALLLKGAGYQLTMPESMVEAVQLLEQRSFDIFLADAGDDLMSIRSFIDKVPRHTAVAAMTASSADSCSPLKYLLSGVDVCIPKPLTAAGITDALRHLES